MSSPIWFSFIWILAASILGFSISAVFAGWMKLPRSRFLIAYVPLVVAFLYAFISLSGIDVAAILLHNLIWGLMAGVITSIFLIRHVLTQPATRSATGAKLILDIGWAGLVYGLVDALFLNVLPVVAIWVGISQYEWSATLAGKILAGILGLIASLLVTLAYHLGYPEFRNKQVFRVLVGNSLMTLAVILSGNPFGALISHPAMHIAATLRGPETTIQLPPHYETAFN